MDEFPDEEDLVAFNSKPLPSQIFQDDDDEEEELEALREMEQETQKENRFKKSLSFSKEPVLKRPRPPMSSSDDSNANKSLPLTDLPEDLDVFKLDLAAPPRKKRQIEPEKEKGADPGPPFVGTENSVTEPQKIHKRIPRGDFQAVTLPEGDRFYLEVREKSQLSDWKHHSSTDGQFGTGLCGMPFALLKEEAEKIKIASEKNIEVLKDFERLNEALMMDAAEENKENENADAPLSTLWVEKFKPRSYLQLLSDDGTNRVLLQWLKYWDKVVFDKEIRVKKRNLTVKEEWKKFPGKGEKKDKGGGGAAIAAASLPSKEENEEDQLDEHDRPKMKVALLHGPPGLGKTTLAHVIAK